MTSTLRPTDEPVRLLFEMTRDHNPRLYDDLIRFNKGTKRVNRLRFLAHEGLVAQHWMAAQGISPIVAPTRAPGESVVSPSVARHTNQVFEAPPLGDEA